MAMPWPKFLDAKYAGKGSLKRKLGLHWPQASHFKLIEEHFNLQSGNSAAGTHLLEKWQGFREMLLAMDKMKHGCIKEKVSDLLANIEEAEGLWFQDDSPEALTFFRYEIEHRPYGSSTLMHPCTSSEFANLKLHILGVLERLDPDTKGQRERAATLMLQNAHNLIWELPKKLNDLAMPMDVPAIKERVRQFFKESMAAWSRLAGSSLERDYLRDWDWVAFKSYSTGVHEGEFRNRLIAAIYRNSNGSTSIKAAVMNTTSSQPHWLSCLSGQGEACITRICPGQGGPWSSNHLGRCGAEEFQIVNIDNGEFD